MAVRQTVSFLGGTASPERLETVRRYFPICSCIFPAAVRPLRIAGRAGLAGDEKPVKFPHESVPGTNGSGLETAAGPVEGYPQIAHAMS